LELLFLKDLALGRTTDLSRTLAPKQIRHFGIFCTGLGQRLAGN